MEKKNPAQRLMTDKTTQKVFREREWIKKEVSCKPVSQTGRVGTSPLSGGVGGFGEGLSCARCWDFSH